MAKQIEVRVVKYPDRKNYVMRYRHPGEQRLIGRSTGTSIKRDAERKAKEWEDELRKERIDDQITWERFRIYFTEHHLDARAAATATAYGATMNALETHSPIDRLSELTTGLVTRFVTKLRGTGVKGSTVQKHIRHLRAIAKWAHEQGQLATVPKFPKQKRGDGPKQKKMKGRPITDAEFGQMIEAVAETPEIIGEEAVESWRLLLRGYWWSGLRLEEAMRLRWDEQPGGISIRFNGKRSLFVFQTGSQKSGNAELCPMAPEAFELLYPLRQAAGYVFNPLGKRGEPLSHTSSTAWTRTITKIGEAAGVVVDVQSGKYASAQDLRRTFGARWARKVKSATLKRMMRHEDINTTMDYYVELDAEDTAAEIWADRK